MRLASTQASRKNAELGHWPGVLTNLPRFRKPWKMIRSRALIQREIEPVALSIEQLPEERPQFGPLAGSKISVKALVGRLEGETVPGSKIEGRDGLFDG